MNVELFVHGVPNGQNFWGNENDKKYFDAFYINASDKVKFLVQTRILNGKLYCYYNYLVYENIIGSGGRTNSYFGISLRFDAYCKDVLNVYRILDSSYNFYVMGKILKYEKTKLKYAISGFESVEKNLKAIEEEILRQLKKVFSQDSFVNLNDFPKSSGNALELNLYDCTMDSIQDAMRKNGQVILSPYYPSYKERNALQQCQQQIKETEANCNNRIKQVNEECEKQKKMINDELTSAKSEIEQHKRTIGEKDYEIKEKDKELTRLKKENKEKEQYNSIKEIVASIQMPINDLAKTMQSIAPEKPQGGVTQYPSQAGKKSMPKLWQSPVFLHILNTILLVLILALLVDHLTLKPTNNFDEAQKTYVTKEDLSKQIQEIVKQSQEAIKRAKPSATDNTNNDLSKVKIDIAEYSGHGDLKIGKKYVVQALNGTAEGTWEVDGGAINKTNDPNKIYVTPEEKTVTITYKMGDKIIEIREIEAK